MDAPDGGAQTQRLFTIEAAVEYLKSIGAVSATASFVRGLISSGQLPHIRIGRRFYVSRTAMDAWLTTHERKSR
jgi:excisionase family DNA binding protein